MTEDINGFDRLVALMRRLRAPGGCPWDAEQTHESLKRYLIEETYEVVEAIDKKDPDLLKEELGDLLLQPIFHSAIAEERGEFAMPDVIDAICDKLVRRHPHVFGNQVVKSAGEQVERWEQIKKQEKGEERKSALSGIPPQMPALMKAQKLTEKAARVGFDWEDIDQVFAKVMEELKELEDSMIAGDQAEIEAELGDLLFAIVNLGRFLSLNPEEALGKTIARFTRRFGYVEEMLHADGKHMQDATLGEMDLLWEEAKRKERAEGE
jgi:tetrapyrrole methylase family protein/MazG family protein